MDPLSIMLYGLVGALFINAMMMWEPLPDSAKA